MPEAGGYNVELAHRLSDHARDDVSSRSLAKLTTKKELAKLFERLILPEFQPAFFAWKNTDPVHNPNAPAGPQQMGEFRSAKMEDAEKLSVQATEAFEEGTSARQRSDGYVRITVTLQQYCCSRRSVSVSRFTLYALPWY